MYRFQPGQRAPEAEDHGQEHTGWSMSNNRMAAAMVARGINVGWLKSIENEPKPVKGAGMPPGMVTKLSLAGVISRAGRATESRAALWKPGPHYTQMLKSIEAVGGRA